METKNVIISNFANAINNIVVNLLGTVSTLNDNAEENAATIKTLNVILEGIRAQTVLIQQAIDNYK